MNSEPTVEERRRPKVGQSVTWLQQRKWGGKQNQPARYLHGVGRLSARIELTDKTEKTVRLSSLRWQWHKENSNG